MKLLESIRKKIEFKYIERLYLLGLLLYTIKVITRLSTIIDLPDSIGDLLYSLSFYLMIPKIVLNRYEKKDCIICFSILILCFFIYHYKHTSILTVIPLALAGLKGSNIRKIIRMIFVITTTFVVIHTIGYFVEHFMNGGTWSNIPFFNRDWQTRNTVLCKDNNDYETLSTLAIMEYIYITDRNKKWFLKMIVLGLLAFGFYAIGTSRTSFLMTFMALPFLFLEKIKFFDKFLRYTTIIVFVATVVLSISFLFVDLNQRIPGRINWFANGRIELSQQAVERYGFSLLPQYEEFKNDPYSIVVDNLVDYLILCDGIIYTAGLFIFSFFMILRVEDPLINYYIDIMCVWCLTERFILFVTLAFVPLLVIHYNYSLKKEKVNE